MEKNLTNKTTVSISLGTIFKIIFILLGIFFVYLIWDVLALVFVALILASAFDPWVDWMNRHKIPRGIGILFIYLVIFSIISSAIILLIPAISNEASDIVRNFPHYYDKIIHWYDKFQNYGNFNNNPQSSNELSTIGGTITDAAGNILNTVFSIFGGIVSFFIILVMTFYLTIEEEALRKFITSLTPRNQRAYVAELIVRIRQKLGLWLRGQIILSVIIFVLSFIGLMILDVRYALLLAFLAGVFEIIPFLGPIISAIPAVFLAFTQEPIKAVFVIILYIIIQQLENHLITPKIMGKTVDLNPIIIIIVLLMGVKLGGVVGAIISIPVATAVSLVVRDIFDKREEEFKNQSA